MGYLVQPGTTAEDLAEQREFAAKLLANASSTKPVGHWTQILAQMAQGGLGGYEQYEAAGEGRRRDDEAAGLFDNAVRSLSAPAGGSVGGQAAGQAAAGPMPASPAMAAAAAAGRDVAPTMVSGGGGGGLLDLTRNEEGFAPRAKWDYQQYSGGYGSRAAPGETFTREKAEQRLQQDAAPVVAWVQKNVPNANPDVKRALVSFGYNLGTDDLDKLLPDMQRGDWARVAQRMTSFNKAGGAVLPNLVGRRGREAALVSGSNAAAAADPTQARLAAASQMFRNPTTRPLAQQMLTAEAARERKTPTVVSIDMGNGQKKSMMQMPDGSLKPIDPAVMGGDGTVPPNFEQTEKLRKEFQTQTSVQNYDTSISTYNSMKSSAPKNTVASDLDLVYGLAKIMDPNSAVREGEFATVQQSASVPEWVKGWGQYLIEGKGKLSPQTRQQMIETARNRIGAYRDQAQMTSDRFSKYATRYGMDPEMITRKFEAPEIYQVPADQLPGASAATAIKWEDGPDGRPRRVK